MTGDMAQLQQAIQDLEAAQRQRQRDVEDVYSNLFQYLYVVFVAVGVVYGAVLQSSQHLPCGCVWSARPVLGTAHNTSACC
jgi:hypothetical protein